MWPADPHNLHNLRRPDFLVISPPKTGSTWLATNLRHHPQIFIPQVKEVRYFSSLYKWLDYRWYCDHFSEAGPRLAGEASPSYAAIPLDRIRLIRQLLPDLKLVFLMRDPLSRAWSHARHSHQFCEANFATSDPTHAAPSEEQWQANFAHDWSLVSGDYLGQLRRWSSVFPAEQLFVGFYESIATRPAELLREVFDFLGVDPDVDLSDSPVRERILVGPTGDLTPTLAANLRGLLRDRTVELIAFLREHYELRPPPEWDSTLNPSDAVLAVPVPGAFLREKDDRFLADVAALEDTFPTAHRPIRGEFRGYDMVCYRGNLYAFSRVLGPISLADLDQSTLNRLQVEGTCVTALTIPELKEKISTRLVAQADARFHTVEHELRESREETARLAAELAGVIAALRRPSRAKRIVRALLGSAQREGRKPR